MTVTALQDEIASDYTSGIADISAEFRNNPSSRKAARDRVVLLDGIIHKIHKSAVADMADLPKISILAVGGYGRKEMFFHSDVDLMFLVEDGAKEQAEPLINLVLHLLWDLKLKIGHSVRYISEAIEESKQDFSTRTNLLEARIVVGTRSISDEFFARFESDIIKDSELEFIEAKLAERAARHKKFGDSRSLLEPNIKEGKGGLRDLQTLMWLMRYCYGARKVADVLALGKISSEELRDFRRARKFLHLVRLHLHDIAGRAEEKLTFDYQRQIAERLGYRTSDDNANQSVERFMKRYFQVTRTTSQLTRTLCFLLEEEWGKQSRNGVKAMWQRGQLPDGLKIVGNRLHFASLEVMLDQPELMIGIFWYLHRLDIEIHPAAWQMLTRNLNIIDADLRRNDVANEGFMQLLLDSKNPVPTLKRMNESGVLGKFIPDFGLLAGQMQFDLYHSYTVDEHILTAIDYMHKIESGQMADELPLASSVMPEIKQRQVMYLALFCHDIAKGRGGDHHIKGVDIGWKLSERFGFNQQEQLDLAWLIEHHQHMSMVAFKRDLGDAKTVDDFTAKVKSIDMLKILYVMTIADIHAVAPNIWNSWKATLLEMLYRKTDDLLNGSSEQLELQSITDSLQTELQSLLPQVKPADIASYIEDADEISLEAYDAETHSRIFPCWQAVQKGDEFSLRFKTHPELGVTQVTIATADRHGLFAQIAGVLAVGGANITDARICTRKDAIIIDRFSIQDESGNPFEEDRRQQRIKQRLKQVQSGDLDLAIAVQEAEARYQSNVAAFEVDSNISFDNDASESYTLIEVQSIDKRGLLYSVTNALTELGLSISSAHIATYGEKIVDVFYVKDSSGEKLHPSGHKAIQRKLMKILG